MTALHAAAELRALAAMPKGDMSRAVHHFVASRLRRWADAAERGDVDALVAACATARAPRKAYQSELAAYREAARVLAAIEVAA